MSDHDNHQTLGLERVKRDLHKLHGEVIRNWGRIEITRDGDREDDRACVLLSKAELMQLERALEIFCEMPGGRAVCDEISRIAAESTSRALGCGNDGGIVFAPKIRLP